MSKKVKNDKKDNNWNTKALSNVCGLMYARYMEKNCTHWDDKCETYTELQALGFKRRNGCCPAFTSANISR